ncbi:MAG TPA: tetratricopeptide repeat protein, partial [Flavobacterium sp.]|nr:tetratricopeptide repeat protein [Flavobacterium sp.]
MRFGNFKFFYLFLLFSISNFSQNLEDKIYNAIDTFVDNPTKHSLEELTLKEKEFSNLVSTKDEQLALVILYCNKGSFEMKNNIQKKAITSYENAWNLFSKNNLVNYDIIEYCLKPLGTLYTKTGNFTLAENIIKKYIFIAEKENNQPTIISGYINLSIVYKTIGNHKTAIDLLQKVEENNQASTLQKKRIQEELTLNKIGLQKNDSSNPLENDVVNYDSNTSKTNAFLALQNNNPDLAITYLEKAKLDLVKNKTFEARELAKLYVDEAIIYIATQEYEKARNSYSKALQTLLPFEKNWVNPKTI